MTACSNKTAALGKEMRIELLRELLSAHSMLGALLGSEKNNKEKTNKKNKENIANVRGKTQMLNYNMRIEKTGGQLNVWGRWKRKRYSGE